MANPLNTKDEPDEKDIDNIFVMLLGAAIYVKSVTFASRPGEDNKLEFGIQATVDPNTALDAAQFFLDAVKKRF